MSLSCPEGLLFPSSAHFAILQPLPFIRWGRFFKKNVLAIHFCWALLNKSSGCVQPFEDPAPPGPARNPQALFSPAVSALLTHFQISSPRFPPFTSPRTLRRTPKHRSALTVSAPPSAASISPRLSKALRKQPLERAAGLVFF